jgi:hypothetical protein
MIKELLETAETFTLEEPRPLMREIPPSSPYPVNALGTILSNAAKVLHEKVQAPMAVCAQSLLAAANLAAQGQADIQLHTKQVKPISEFFVSCLESGGRKSTVDELALTEHRAKEEELARDYRLTKKDYQDAVEVYEKARQHILKPKAKFDMVNQRLELQALGQEPKEPLHPILTLSEANPAGLYRTQECGQPSMGVFTSEGGLMVGGNGMSNDYKLEMAALLSKLWDGAASRKGRSGSGVSELKNRRFSMHLMIQPEIAALFLQDPILVTQGLISRVLVVAPSSMQGLRRFKEMDADFEIAMAPYNAAIRILLEKPYRLIDGSRNEIKPRVVTLSSEARQCLIQYSDHVETQLRPNGEMETIRPLANKLPEHAARLACTIALIEDPQVAELSLSHITNGIALADYYAEEAIRLNAYSEADSHLLIAQRTLDWLFTWPEEFISLPDIYQKGPSRVRNQQEARRVVSVLEDHGWLLQMERAEIVNGKKRNEVWRIRRVKG